MTTPDVTILFESRTRVKRIRLEVGDGQYILISPHGYSDTERIKFLLHNQRWIKRQHRKLCAHAVDLSPPLEIGSVHLWGKTARLVVKLSDVFRYRVDSNCHVLRIELNHQVPVYAFERAVRATLGSLYQEQVRFAVEHLIAPRYSAKCDLRPMKIRYKLMKSQWGSLNAQGIMTLNWNLGLAPPVILEYLYVHELAHLRYKNHGKRFWGLVERLMPTYAECEQWLRHHGAHIMAWSHRYAKI